MKGNDHGQMDFASRGLLQQVRRDKPHHHPKASAYPDSQAQPQDFIPVGGTSGFAGFE
jgi:hypothetical protein